MGCSWGLSFVGPYLSHKKVGGLDVQKDIVVETLTGQRTGQWTRHFDGQECLVR